MPYTVDLVHPPDVPRLAGIQWAALSDNPLIQCLYPRGATPELTDFTTLSYQKAFMFPSATLLKATDDATGEIVGFAKWILYRQDEETQLRASLSSDDQRRSGGSSRRSSGWQKEKHLMPSTPPDCHAVLLEHWGEIMNKTRKRIPGPRGHACSTGAPCSLECYFANFSDNLWVLDILHVLPLHQRNGAGASLINWGLGRADSEGVECYVETSPAARSLCVTKGFRHIAEMRIELGRWKENYPDYRHSVMIRPPYGEVEPLEAPAKEEDPFQENGPLSPIEEQAISPVSEIDEPAYTAEARMLEFKSTSSLRTARLRDARRSTSNRSSRISTMYLDDNRPLPQTPEVA